MDKETVVYIYIYIYTMEYYSAIKNDIIMAFAGKWMNMENIMLSEISHSQKNQRTNYLTDKQMITHIAGGKGERMEEGGTL